MASTSNNSEDDFLRGQFDDQESDASDISDSSDEGASDVDEQPSDLNWEWSSVEEESESEEYADATPAPPPLKWWQYKSPKRPALPADLTDEEIDSKDFDLTLEPPPKKQPAYTCMSQEERAQPPSPNPSASTPTQPPSSTQPPAPVRQGAQTTSPDGTVWTRRPTPATKTNRAIVLTQAEGPQDLGGASTPLELFELFFPAAMMQIILEKTNVLGLAKRGQSWVDLTMVELKAAIGLLFYLGMTKSGHEKVRTFWAPGIFSKPTCQATMPVNRFEDIINLMRFDNKEIHSRRKATDKFAPIREIFDMFTAALRRHFSPGECITIDKQMVAFRGCCSFKQPSPNKPAKYGIKFWASVDSENHYVHNMIPYIGKNHSTVEKQLGPSVVKELVQPLHGTGRNVTADHFFVSKHLADFLLSKNLTLVGTIKSIRQEVPHELRKQNIEDRAVKSSKFMFSGMTTMVSFVPKRHRQVLLLSTKHHNKAVDHATHKPKIISYYNATKVGVDTVDHICSLYNCARITKRWPMVVFYHMLNIAALNAFVLFQHVHQNSPGEVQTRRDFLKQLVNALIQPQIEIRASHPERLRGKTILAMQCIGYDVAVRQQPVEVQSREYKTRSCYLCPRGLKARTTRVCSGCKHFSCTQHSISRRTTESFCSNCLQTK